jgi:2-methylcitrate dehydratase PrpD
MSAFVNSVAGHGFEMDDYCTGTMAHPGCVAVPASLALAEEIDTDGSDFLLAAAIGFEVIIRMSLATMPSMLMERGFHHTSVLGVIGAAASSAKLLGLNANGTLMALGLAASEAGGIVEYAETGGDVKRLHAGFGSSNGIRAARLAAAGISAPPTSLEGRRGFLRAFSPMPNPQALTADLGERWELLDRLSIKPYCCAGAIHPAIDCLHEIMQEEGLSWSEIAKIEVGASRHSLQHTGTIGPEPTDLTAAQFSAHYSLALTAVKGANDFRSYMDAAAGAFQDHALLEVAHRVVVELDDEVEGVFSEGYLGKVAVTTRNGTRFAARGFARGSKQRPLTDPDVEAKFAGNASTLLSSEDEKRVRELISTLDQRTNIRNLGAVLSRQQ